MKQIPTEGYDRLMEALRHYAPARIEALKGKKPRIGLMRLGKAMSGVYIGFGGIYLNSNLIKDLDEMTELGWLSVIAHELEHFRQGALTAFSVYGELLAWKAGFEVLQKAPESMLSDLAIRILELPDLMDRKNLIKARDLMYAYAGKEYGIQWRPLYPLQLEVLYWLGLRR